MKHNYKIYAKALVRALDLKISEEKIISNFLNLLKKNNDLSQIKKIIDYAEKLLYEKSNQKKITVEVARNYENLINRFKEIFPNDDILLKINPSLIAGLKILINNEKQIDFSLKNKLNKILK